MRFLKLAVGGYVVESMHHLPLRQEIRPTPSAESLLFGAFWQGLHAMQSDRSQGKVVSKYLQRASRLPMLAEPRTPISWGRPRGLRAKHQIGTLERVTQWIRVRASDQGTR